MTDATREISTKGTFNDRNNHSDSQKLVRHSATGGRNGDILSRERDDRADGTGSDVQFHAEDGSGQVSSGSEGRNSCSQSGDPLHFLNTLPREQVEQLVRPRVEPLAFRQIVASPAYQMPEIPSDADKFAKDYVRKYALEQWVVDHLVAAYGVGRAVGFRECALEVIDVVKAGAK